MLKSVAIFCGSSKGNNPIYEKVASQYAVLLAKDNIKIYYGGGNTGIMGVLADSALKNSAYIIGVVPGFLKMQNIVNDKLSELHIVNSLAERKTFFIENADAFAVLPGGIGTMDEFFDVFTALQLEVIQKPVGILNTNGYYDKLIEMLKNMVSEKFLKLEHFESLVIEGNVNKFHKRLISHIPPRVNDWIAELKKHNKYL